MYNYSLELSYKNSDNDTIYRKELLEAFRLKEYDFDKITSILDTEIIPIIKNHFDPIFKALNKYNRFPFSLDEKICCTILLSWEYFYLFHKCIGEIFIEKIYDNNQIKIGEAITELISAIEKERSN